MKEQFKMVRPASLEDNFAESGKQEKPSDAEAMAGRRQEAGNLNNEIMRIQGGRNLEDLEVDELKKVLELYNKIKSIGKRETEAREGKIDGPVEEQISRAREIMGDSEVMGINEVKSAFGIEVPESEVPPIPFSKTELERAKELNQFLVLRVDKAKDGNPLTMQKINESLSQDFKDESKGKILYDVDWYAEEPFYTGGEDTEQTALKSEWALTSKKIIEDSNSKNYLEQSLEIAEYLEREVFLGIEMPDEYKEAISELKDKKEELAKLIETNDRNKYEPELSKLKINKLTRQSSVETLYDILIYFQNNDERLLEDKYAWTHTATSDGSRVYVGHFDSGGAGVNGDSDDDSNSSLGVVFSRNF